MASSNTPTRTFTLASRGSQLAQVQTNIALAALEAIPQPSSSKRYAFKTSFMATGGDKNQSQALFILGGKSLWTKELEVALKENVVDMLVHSLKDVPTVLPEGCILGAVLKREDPVDSLVIRRGKEEEWKTLEDLPDGSVVGTSSVRRVAQLRRRFPRLQFKDVRGNLNTRLSKLDAPDAPYAALILAKAGLVRIGLGHRITSDISSPTLYHAVSQGALGVEIRADDAEAIELCKALTHWETQWTCFAERACLRVLEGGCSVPVGVESKLDVTRSTDRKLKSIVLTLTGSVTAIAGDKHVEHTLSEAVESLEEAEALGAKLARILIDTGAKEILDDINKDREMRIGEAKSADEVGKIHAAMEAST